MMKRYNLLLLFLLIPFLAYGQEVLQTFDTAAVDSFMQVGRWGEWDTPDGEKNNITLADDADHMVGSGSLRLDYWVRTPHHGGWWGGGAWIEHYASAGEHLPDLSKMTRFVLWYKIVAAQADTGSYDNMDLRMQLFDDSDGAREQWYTTTTIELDSIDGKWHMVTIPIVDLGLDKDDLPSTGFTLPSWEGYKGNGVLNLNQLAGWKFEIVGGNATNYTQGTILFDHLMALGDEVVLEKFDSAVADSVMQVGRWGEWDTPDGERNQITLADTTEHLIGDGAIRLDYWVRAPHHGGWWGGGAWIEHYAPAGEHLPDLSTSTHFLVWYKILAAKADTGSYDYLQLRMQLFDDSEGAREQWYHRTTVKLDSLSSGWNLLSVPIVDLGPDQDALPSTGFTLPSWEGYKGNGVLNLNSLAGWKFEIVGDGALLYTSGTLLMDHLVAVGSREQELDTTPPVAVQGVAAVPEPDEKFNLVIWQDVPNESGERYTVYASQEPITDVSAPGVEVIAARVAENTQTFVHYLYHPLQDKTVTYYYAVSAIDKAGNVGESGVFAAGVNNTAKGVATIALNVPANVAIDGDLSEWYASGIMPFVFKQSTSHFTGTFDNDDDYSATMFMAMDNEYFYFAIDAIDNVHSFDPAGDWWQDDAIEMFFGLYDGRPGPPHGSRLRGPKPDYALQFRYDGLFNADNSGRQVYGRDSTNFYFEGFGSDYVIETKIRLSDITFGDDAPFVPVNGTRIPLDFSIHDSDVANQRDGVMALSPNNNDNSWQSPRNWTYTWIGDRDTPVGVDENPVGTPTEYSLSQNYPNPFNPTTSINYSIRKAGLVKIELYNTLGQKVRTLVDEVKPAGNHTLEVQANNLPSGVYFYRINAGDFRQTRKMLLMK